MNIIPYLFLLRLCFSYQCAFAMLIQSKVCPHLQLCLFLQKLHFLFQGRCEREGLPDSTSKSCTQSIGIPNYFQNNDTVQLPTRVQFNCNHKDIVQRNQLTITFHQKAPSQENVTSWNRLDGVIFTPLYLGKIVIQIQYFCKITT